MPWLPDQHACFIGQLPAGFYAPVNPFFCSVERMLLPLLLMTYPRCNCPDNLMIRFNFSGLGRSSSAVLTFKLQVPLSLLLVRTLFN